MHPNRGFTLIELLVVIAIIGVLSSVVLASLNTARARANDAKRHADTRQIMLALELYYNANGTYPPPSTTISASDLLVLVPTYISAVPRDPLDPGAHGGSLGYRYCSDAGNQNYTVLAYLQKTASWCGRSSGIPACGWGIYTACQ